MWSALIKLRSILSLYDREKQYYSSFVSFQGMQGGYKHVIPKTNKYMKHF